ncbi:MAG: energy transducer TonB [Thermoanaerobaculia bacterium]|nr:energy transducer TonB [Thermoanaerobaculia bacterium]
MTDFADNPRKPHKNAGKDLKPLYRTRIMLGLVVSLGIMITLVRTDLRSGTEGLDIQLAEQEVVQMEEILQTEQIERPPAPPRPRVPVAVPDDIILEDETLEFDASLDIDAAITDVPPPPPQPVFEEEEETAAEDEIFVIVEEMPQIVGGNSRIYELLEYPEIARQAGVEGLVVVQVVIEPDGSPSNPEIARSAGEVLDKAAIEAVMQLRFEPGKQRGKAVRVKMALPIRFKLRDAGSK